MLCYCHRPFRGRRRSPLRLRWHRGSRSARRPCSVHPYGGRATGFQPLSPKTVGYLDGSERYRVDGVPVCGSLLLCLRACRANAQQGCYQVLFHRLAIFKITVFLDTKVKKSAQTTDRRIRKSWLTNTIQPRFQAINPTTTSFRIWQTAPVPSPSSYT